MTKRARLAVLIFAAVLVSSQAGAQESPEQLFAELQRVTPDPLRSYKVNDLFLRRDAVRLHLQHGTLVFLQPVAGRVTGALFEGAGQVLVQPPNRADRHQLRKFTHSPILAESFPRAYFRFSDLTAGEFLQQIRGGAGRAVHEPELLARWEPALDRLNRAHALRLLLDFLETPRPYFYAAIQSPRLGPFDVVLDARRSEEVLVGQTRWSGQERFYDVWCSFPRSRKETAGPPAHITRARIETTIGEDGALEATAELEVQVPRAARVLLFQLSRNLQVNRVQWRSRRNIWHSLDFFQNTSLSEKEALFYGADALLVVLPATTTGRQELRFYYRGRIIRDLGAGVLFVGARGFWYPFIDSGQLAHYELRFRYPAQREVAATGIRQETHREGAWKESTWVTETPVPIAGFNIGDYESHEVAGRVARVVAYANRQLEPFLARALRQGFRASPRTRERESPPRASPRNGREKPGSPLAGPTSRLERVATKVEAALADFSDWFWPFPYSSLQVSQIPGFFGQGYPGLLYLSTLSFLPEDSQMRLGLDQRDREFFTDLAPAHETAHQWWGNRVRFAWYRDHWLNEGLASYSALLHLAEQAGSQAVLRRWLERYQEDLQAPGPAGEPVEATGALILGPRLDSSRSPDGLVQVLYSKGPWVIHMLRELFRDPKTGSDQTFFRALRSLAADGGTATTADFQTRLEAALPAHADVEQTGHLDWFFNQWVYDTGVPRYKLDWRAERAPQSGWVVDGSIRQSDVPLSFTMPVPVYAETPSGRDRLGRVIVTGEEVRFRFRLEERPEEVLLDPYQTVLSFPAPEAR